MGGTLSKFSILLSMGFLFLELLDPTTPFVRVHAPAGIQHSTVSSTAVSHSISTPRRIAVPKPDYNAAPDVKDFKSPCACAEPFMAAASVVPIELPSPRFMFVPIKLCPSDDLS